MKFHRAKSQIPGQREGLQPKLGRLIVTIDVNMRPVRLVHDYESTHDTDLIAERSATT
jgi:hypothetical protein